MTILEIAGIQDSRGDTSRARGDRALWPMPNTRKRPSRYFKDRAIQRNLAGQSKEMYRALRQEGMPVQLLLFPREDHGALAGNFAGRPSTEPWAAVIAREHMINFISDAFAGLAESNKP